MHGTPFQKSLDASGYKGWYESGVPNTYTHVKFLFLYHDRGANVTEHDGIFSFLHRTIMYFVSSYGNPLPL